ncbi:MAG TPA: hypothetical protein VK530_20495, partial [Candidatus Acidoferrum sp.]|nr:hypothetical protein [Candidatus Acidoferrum sp.]
RFVDVVRDEKHRCAARLPESQNFVLHSHSRKGVERAKRFVEEQNFGMIEKRASECDALCHAAGKMMRICIRKSFETDKPHEFIHLVPLFVKHIPRDKTGLNVATDGQPRKKIRILKNQTALGAGGRDQFRAHEQLAGIR